MTYVSAEARQELLDTIADAIDELATALAALGAAFAAQLGTMQVNEEIDALTTMGISPMEFLVLPLPEGQYVLWFRGEAVRHIDWGGDPHNKAIAAREGDEVRLSPRKSFERWQEVVRGRSEPWARRSRS